MYTSYIQINPTKLNYKNSIYVPINVTFNTCPLPPHTYNRYAERISLEI